MTSVLLGQQTSRLVIVLSCISALVPIQYARLQGLPRLGLGPVYSADAIPSGVRLWRKRKFCFNEYTRRWYDSTAAFASS